MRQHFSGQLENMRTDLTDLCSLTETAIDHATRALLDTDLGASEACADVDTEIGYRAQEIDHRALTLIALQAPVAQDLRALISGIHNIADLRRMGSLAAHVAEVARLHFPAPVVPVSFGVSSRRWVWQRRRRLRRPPRYCVTATASGRWN